MKMGRFGRRMIVRKLEAAMKACAVLAVLVLWGAPAMAQTVATYSFENSVDGWTSFDGATMPVASKGAAYVGSYSLLTTTGASGAGGPSIALNTVLQAGATYTITGWVELTSGESASNANFTIARTDASCPSGTCYDTIGSYKVAVDSSNWAEIGGSYTVSATETGLTLYAQLVGATSAQSFYLDDVVITETAPPPGGNAVASYTFDGSTDGWTPFGSATLSSVTSPIADPAGNAHSLLVANRTAGYMGPSLNLLGVNNIVAGATYQVTAYVLLAQADPANPTVTISTKTPVGISPSEIGKLPEVTVGVHDPLSSSGSNRMPVRTVSYAGPASPFFAVNVHTRACLGPLSPVRETRSPYPGNCDFSPIIPQ